MLEAWLFVSHWNWTGSFFGFVSLTQKSASESFKKYFKNSTEMNTVKREAKAEWDSIKVSQWSACKQDTVRIMCHPSREVRTAESHPWIHSGASGQPRSLENWAGGVGALVQIRKYLPCNWARFYTDHSVEQSPHIQEGFTRDKSKISTLGTPRPLWMIGSTSHCPMLLSNTHKNPQSPPGTGRSFGKSFRWKRHEFPQLLFD